jgi:hypothetical protein
LSVSKVTNASITNTSYSFPTSITITFA